MKLIIPKILILAAVLSLALAVNGYSQYPREGDPINTAATEAEVSTTPEDIPGAHAAAMAALELKTQTLDNNMHIDETVPIPDFYQPVREAAEAEAKEKGRTITDYRDNGLDFIIVEFSDGGFTYYRRDGEKGYTYEP